MVRYAAQRVGLLLLTLALVALVIFTITSFLPTDAAETKLGILATPESLEFVRQQLGLDQPVLVRFWSWFGGALRGDFGTSLVFQTEIGPLVMARLANSAVLAGLVLLISVPLGIVLGMWAGSREGGAIDRIISWVTLTAFSFPEFVWAILLIFVFANILGVLPAASIITGSPFDDPAKLVMPVATATIVVLALTIRMMRQGTVQTLELDYVRTARLKGLSEWKVFRKHVMGNAIAPAVTATGTNVAYLLGSLAVVETIFSFPGIGSLTVQAANNRDVPLLAAAVLLTSAIVTTANLVADLIVVGLNPRLRKS
ncbi:ABC transporter permease [Demequina salsinemoris]|uniref:ABC transporter permease n=1 Tax=Demequina salsinemoris TaxID=577470 RepID=UPI000A0351E9|nr:ABC transporter permease [Demequina salsinemoris]